MNPLPLTNGALFVSSSFLDTLVCPRYSQHYKLDSRILKTEGAGLRFGSHLHSALSLNYRLQEYTLTDAQIQSRVIELLEKEFSREPNDESDWRNLNWASEIYQQHARKFAFESFDLMRYKEPRVCKNCQGQVETSSQRNDCLWCNGTGLTSVMSEVTFVVKLFIYTGYWTLTIERVDELRAQGISVINTRGCEYRVCFPVYYHGIIDLLVSINNLLFVLDFKSTSKLGQSYWDDKKAIAQPKGYCLAVEQTLGIKPHGYIVRALRTLEPPKYVTDGTASKKGEFKKISDWWDESLVEQRFDLGDGELDEWKNNAIEQVEQFLWHYSRGYFSQNKSMCVAKYGKCQYYETCSTFPAKDRETILSSELYKDKEPNINLTIEKQ